METLCVEIKSNIVSLSVTFLCDLLVICKAEVRSTRPYKTFIFCSSEALNCCVVDSVIQKFFCHNIFKPDIYLNIPVCCITSGAKFTDWGSEFTQHGRNVNSRYQMVSIR